MSGRELTMEIEWPGHGVVLLLDGCYRGAFFNNNRCIPNGLFATTACADDEYTPRPLIRAMIQVVAPQLGERVYDGACGSAGFLCESFDYLKQANPQRSTAQKRALRERTFYGKEKKSPAYVIVIKNTFLSISDNASVSLRKLLLENCNLHAVLDCPGGTFQGAGVKTVVLFFEKGSKTRKVWFYQLDPGRNLGKTNPLNAADLAEFVKLAKSRADSPKSWKVDVKDIDPATCDLSVKNPNGGEEIAHRSPKEIMREIAALDAESTEVLAGIRKLL